MKRKKYQASDERTVLTGMIVNDEVLGAIARNVTADESPFRNRWSNMVARWCFQHWEKYKKAPKDTIANRFVNFAKTCKDDDLVDLIEAYLGSLNNDLVVQGKEMNAPFIIDTASRFFKEVRYERLVKQIGSALEDKNLPKADEIFHSYRPIDFTQEAETNPFEKRKIKEHLTREEDKTLISFPGGLGEFFGRAFERDSFISFTGPEKRGKSFWLMEIVYQALRQRRKVLYIVTGDMSERQAFVRFYSRVSRHPRHEADKDLIIPTRFRKKKKEITVVTKTVERPPMTPNIVRKSMDDFLRRTGAKESRLKTKIHPSSSVSASDVDMTLEKFLKEGWLPDVVVIDYADILVPEPHTRQMEYRHQINETWKLLRRMSQKYHICVVTATQAAATSYDAKTISKKDFSDDKRKLGHVTGMIGINQLSEEKVEGHYRLNWVVLREGHWAEHQVVHTAGNLAIASPCIISSLF